MSLYGEILNHLASHPTREFLVDARALRKLTEEMAELRRQITHAHKALFDHHCVIFSCEKHWPTDVASWPSDEKVK